MPSKELAMTAKNTSSYSIKNVLLAFGMMVFLVMSFKLAGGLTDDPNQETAMSTSDSVFSSLQKPSITPNAP